MYQANDKLLVWGSDIEQGTLDQAAMASRLPEVYGHVALMPDAHVGIGATVGSVIPTENMVVPSFAGVDLGCGMIGTKTIYTLEDLPDNLDRLMPLIEQRIPAGVGKGHARPYGAPPSKNPFHVLGGPRTELTGKQNNTAIDQFGTLGSGNHFVEISIGLDGHVWAVLHSGSRGIGNQLARYHMDVAKSLIPDGSQLEDKNLAKLVQGTQQFDHYITDMLWAQAYAFQSRSLMMDEALRSLAEVVGSKRVASLRLPQTNIEVDRINCHHNFTAYEEHDGKWLWVTRKGAIKAEQGDRGIIPGSMGSDTYIVSGNGVSESWNSCSHGAGRRLSRTAAKRQFSEEDLQNQMSGVKVWNKTDAGSLRDESPLSYKDITTVMADQSDLVTVDDRLYQVFNYKGTK